MRGLVLNSFGILFLLLFPFIVVAQAKCWEGGIERDPGMRLITRGKIFGWVPFEDLYVVTTTLGAEYKFAKRHSIGSDIIWTKYWHENDSTNSITGEEYGEGFFQYETRSIFSMDYRFYLVVRNQRCKYRGLYLSAFRRSANIKWRSCDDYVFTKDEYITKNAVFRDMGFAVGFRIGSDRCDRWGFDTSLGMANRLKTEDSEKYISLAQTEIVLDEKSESWLPVFRFNVTYAFILPKHLRPPKEAEIPQ